MKWTVYELHKRLLGVGGTFAYPVASYDGFIPLVCFYSEINLFCGQHLNHLLASRQLMLLIRGHIFCKLMVNSTKSVLCWILGRRKKLAVLLIEGFWGLPARLLEY